MERGAPFVHTIWENWGQIADEALLDKGFQGGAPNVCNSAKWRTPFSALLSVKGGGLTRIRAQGWENQTPFHSSSVDFGERFKRLFSAFLDIPKSWAAIVWFPSARLSASEIVSCSTSFKAGSLISADNPSANVLAPAFSVLISRQSKDCLSISCRKDAMECTPPLCRRLLF